MTKDEYRSMYKSKRLQLTSGEIKKYDTDILNQLFKLDLSDINYLHIYMSILKYNEPDTMGFIRYLRDKHPMIKLVISKTNFDNHSMINYLWDEELTLKESKWGIFEPDNGQLIDEKEIDMVIVPLLVSDVNGNRVGYGKGFYDRFLSKCKPSVKKIGISYFDPVDKIDDIGDWDVPLDLLITPFGSFQFN